MPTYDCRAGAGRAPGALSFPCAVRVLDPATGKRIPNVFYLSTSPARLGRFLVGPDGEPLARATGRKVRGRPIHTAGIDGRATSGAAGKVVPAAVKEYERLEVFEDRPFVVVRLDTGEVFLKSEGAA